MLQKIINIIKNNIKYKLVPLSNYVRDTYGNRFKPFSSWKYSYVDIKQKVLTEEIIENLLLRFDQNKKPYYSSDKKTILDYRVKITKEKFGLELYNSIINELGSKILNELRVQIKNINLNVDKCEIYETQNYDQNQLDKMNEENLHNNFTWHYDGGGSMYKMQILLTPSNSSNCLHIIDEKQLNPKFKFKYEDVRFVKYKPEKNKLIKFVGKKGDAAIFNTSLLHKAGLSSTKDERRVVAVLNFS